MSRVNQGHLDIDAEARWRVVEQDSVRNGRTHLPLGRHVLDYQFERVRAL